MRIYTENDKASQPRPALGAAGKLNELVVRVKVIPPTVLLGDCGSWLLGILLRDAELADSLTAGDEALQRCVRSLVVVYLTGVDLSGNEVLPESMALLEDVDDEVGILPCITNDGDDTITASHLVILEDRRISAGLVVRFILLRNLR